MKFSVKDFLNKCEKILDGKFRFMCCESLRGKESVFKKKKKKKNQLLKKKYLSQHYGHFFL